MSRRLWRDCHEIVMVVRSERVVSKQNGSNRPICIPLKKGIRNRVENFPNGSEPSCVLLNRCTDRSRTCPIAAKVASSNCFFELIQTQISHQFSQSRVLATRSPWRGVSKLCLTDPHEPVRNCTITCHKPRQEIEGIKNQWVTNSRLRSQNPPIPCANQPIFLVYRACDLSACAACAVRFGPVTS
jgi:hypothetical protein